MRASLGPCALGSASTSHRHAQPSTCLAETRAWQGHRPLTNKLRQQLMHATHQQQQQRAQRLVVSAGDVPELDLSDMDGLPQDAYPLRHAEGGYTPFEYIEFTNTPLRHELSIPVDAPVDKAYACWADRLNWLYFFEDFIDEVGFHEEDPSLVSMYLWYRWAMTPKLELYVTLKRTQDEKNKFILEEPFEGMPLVVAVLFQPASEVEGLEGQQGTVVTLRVQYLLPRVLHEFAGQVAVYADVDKKLGVAMQAMKAFVEEVDLADLEHARQEEAELLKEGFAEQRKRQAEMEAEQEEERQRRQELYAQWQQSQQASSQSEQGEAQASGLASQSDASDDDGTGSGTKGRRGRPRRRTASTGSTGTGGSGSTSESAGGKAAFSSSSSSKYSASVPDGWEDLEQQQHFGTVAEADWPVLEDEGLGSLLGGLQGSHRGSTGGAAAAIP